MIFKNKKKIKATPKYDETCGVVSFDIPKKSKKERRNEKTVVHNEEPLLPDIPDLDPELSNKIRTELIHRYDQVSSIKTIEIPKKYKNNPVSSSNFLHLH